MMDFVAAVLVLTFPALAIVAALKDLVSYTIPNWISLSLLVAFPTAALAAGLSLLDIAWHVGAGFVALIIGMALFFMRWIGGGDAKLFAVSVLWLGWPASETFAIVTMLAGGGLALGLITLRSARLRPLVLLGPPWVTRLAEPGEGVPYGLAMALGALAAFQHSAFMAAALHI